MPKICYVERKFSADSQALIANALTIFDSYQADGYILTLRQLYYQFVSRDLLANNVQSYKRLDSVINDARLAGLIDWELMEDRTRNLQSQPNWSSPSEIISACARQYRIDKWADQNYRPEVWIEKDALAGVFERVCSEMQVPYFSCRGYTSQSEMWVAGQRMKEHFDNGQEPIVLHFGDHDPSGIDMTRDITDRLEMFVGDKVVVRRLALNMEQVEEYSPPPNPAKLTDSRAQDYIDKFGDESWELDALPPDVLAGLARDEIADLRDEDKWEHSVKEEKIQRDAIGSVSRQWDQVVKRFAKKRKD